MYLPLPRVRTAAWLCAVRAIALATLVGTTAGCAEPPQKELDQAQAAIEVAVAAGAERLAPADLTAARTAFNQANEAVAQRDHKLALGHALDARERAQAATQAATEAQARLRDDSERAFREATALLDRLREGRPAAASTRIARARVRTARAAEARLSASLQKARASIDAQDYAAAQALLSRLETELEDALREVDGEAPAQSSRRGR
jgi:hypothetical protein